MTERISDNEEDFPDDDINQNPDIESHEYDGIKELDNPPPRWIMAVFYLTIGISILYGAYYFWLKVGNQQEAEYQRSLEKARQKYAREQAVGPVVRLTDEASVSAGREIYVAMNCATCHGQNGEGNAIGPNLTDDAWVHGCQIDNIFTTIKNGYPIKGMTAFKAQLSDEKIQQVASFIMSIRGTNPPNAKTPEGEPCR